MTKRYFHISVGGYINELKIGQVSRDFLEYWKDQDDSDLLDAMDGYGDDVPEEMMPPFDSWNEADDVCGIFSIHEDSEYELHEIKPHPDTKFVDGELVWKRGKQPPFDEKNPFKDQIFDFISESKKILGNDIGYEQEVYWTNADDADEEEQDTLTPIVIFHAIDKGYLGDIFVVLDDEDFNPKKFQHSYIETSAGMFASQWWYDRKPLTLQHNGDSTGKSFDISYGFIDLNGQASFDYSYTPKGNEKKNLKEAFDEWYFNNEET